MRMFTTPLLLSLSLLACLAMVPSLKAEKEKKIKDIQTADKSDSTEETEPAENAGLLQAAYTDLTSADHDYDGHRAAAAATVKHFADQHKIAVVDGERAIGESQAASDAKLRDALAKIEQIIDNPAAEEDRSKHPRIRKEQPAHLEKAVDEIKTALNII